MPEEPFYFAEGKLVAADWSMVLPPLSAWRLDGSDAPDTSEVCADARPPG
jgi:hypothetical protein